MRAVIHLHVVAVFGVQKLSAMGIIGPAAALLASIIFITLEIVVPAVLVFELDPSPAAVRRLCAQRACP